MTDPVIKRVPQKGPDARWYSDLENAIKSTAIAIDVASIPANTTAEQTFTVDGVKTTDTIIASKPSHTTGLSITGARASDANEIAITFMNATGTVIDPPSETYKIIVIRG